MSSAASSPKMSSAAPRVRHCGRCGSTLHTAPKCDKDARRAAEEAARISAQRDAFAAKPIQEQLLWLYDEITSMNLDVKSLKDEMESTARQVELLETRLDGRDTHW